METIISIYYDAIEDFLHDLEDAFDSDLELVAEYLKTLKVDHGLVREIQEESVIEYEKTLKRCSD